MTQTPISIKVNVNMSKEVAAYFKDKDLSKIIDILLERYEIANLPPVERPRYTYRTVEITNEYFITLYNALGARNKKVSLSRLVEFAYDMDVLSNPEFDNMQIEPQTQIREDVLTPEGNIQNFIVSQARKAYTALSKIKQYDTTDMLDDIIKLVYNYYKVVEEDSKRAVQ